MNTVLKIIVFGIAIALFKSVEAENKTYKPEWSDLDSRPLPQWYDEAKIGIFLHWGVYSVPSYAPAKLAGEWFWRYLSKGDAGCINFMKNNYAPSFTYQDFGPMFTAEMFDPTEWADIFVNAGAKYVVLTSKHHEGYTLFPSKHSFSWNSVDVGPKRDLVKDLSAAVRDKQIKFGVYYSLMEWYNPLYMDDAASGYTTHEYPYSKMWPDIMQLVNDYQPSVIWADGEWEALSGYWNSTGLLAWLYNDSPVKDEIVVNDRWGSDTRKTHGGFYNGDDAENPQKRMEHKWEVAFTVDKHPSWGFRRNIKLSDVQDVDYLLQQVVSAVSCGGNALINIGPTKEGTIPLIFQERLLSLGNWLKINGEAIYKTSPWLHQKDTLNPDVWYTCTKVKYNAESPTAVPSNTDDVTAIYAISLKWPEDNVLKIADIADTLKNNKYQAQLMGGKDYLQYKLQENGTVEISFPDKATVTSNNAWTVKFTRNN